MPPNNVPAMDRFLMRLDIIEGSECIFWKDPLMKNGYGQLCVNGGFFLAHRFSYSQFIGPIPPGICIDHICRQRNCVNPSHLRLVTRKENTIQNSIGPTALNMAKTHCIYGHEFTPENTYRTHSSTGPKRACKICSKRREKKYRDRILLGKSA